MAASDPQANGHGRQGCDAAVAAVVARREGDQRPRSVVRLAAREGGTGLCGQARSSRRGWHRRRGGAAAPLPARRGHGHIPCGVPASRCLDPQSARSRLATRGTRAHHARDDTPRVWGGARLVGNAIARTAHALAQTAHALAQRDRQSARRRGRKRTALAIGIPILLLFHVPVHCAVCVCGCWAVRGGLVCVRWSRRSCVGPL